MSVIKKSTLYPFILALLFLGLSASMVTARIFIATELVSGQVISISDKNIIELEDGNLYYPAKQSLELSIDPQTHISIKYYINANDERIYIDYAPGKNSLKATPIPDRLKKPKNKR